MSIAFNNYVEGQMNLLKQYFDALGEAKTPVRIVLQDPIEKADKDAISYYKAITADCKKLGLEVIDKEDLGCPTLVITSANSSEELPPIMPVTDVDNLRHSKYESPIGQGVCDYLDHLTSLRESTVTVIGRGKRAGKPIIDSLIKRGATVICCNSKTDSLDMSNYMKNSDIIITAINEPEFFNYDQSFLVGKIIVDCGCCWSQSKEKLVGNLDMDMINRIENKSREIVRFFKGTGILTRIGLLKNIYRCMLLLETYDESYLNFDKWYEFYPPNIN